MVLLRKFIVTLFLLTGSLISFSANYHWVGGSGNWSDLGHWSSISNGAPDKILLPTSLDDVFFDASSFGVAGETVTLDVNGLTSNLDFSGAVPFDFSSLGANALQVSGDITMTSNVDFTGFTTSITLEGSALGVSHTINTGGTSLITMDLIINTLLVTDEYVVSGADLTVKDLILEQGTLRLDGQDVSCNVLDANEASDNVRSFDFGGRTLTVRFAGATAAVDFQSVGGNVSVSNAASSTISGLTGGTFIVEAGANDISIPNIFLANATRLELFTNKVATDNASLVTFNDINMARISGSVLQFDVDVNGGSLGTVKQYGNITFASGMSVSMNHPHGTAYGTENSIVNGNFTLSDNSSGTITGDFFDVTGDFNSGDSFLFTFNDKLRVQGTFTLGTTVFAGVRFRDETTFGSDVAFNGTADVRFTNDATIAGNVTTAASSTLTFQNASFPTITTTGTWDIANGTNIDFGTNVSGRWNFNSQVTINGSNTIDLNSGSVGAVFINFADVVIAGSADINMTTDVNFNGSLSIANNATVNLTNGTSTPDITASGAWTTGTGVNLTLGNAQNGIWSFTGTSSFTLGDNSNVVADCGTNDFDFNDFTMGSNGSLTIKDGQTTNINGDFITGGVACTFTNQIQSTSPGSQALLNLSVLEAEISLGIEDINVVSSNLTVTDGVDEGGNLGITFNDGTGGLFWVGGTSAADVAGKTGTYSTGDNTNWSNPDNWSGTSGVYSGSNSCLPNISRSVVVDALSIDPTGDLTITLDQDASVENFTMEANEDVINFTGSNVLTLTIDGDLDLDPETDYSTFTSSIALTGGAGGATNTVNSHGATTTNTDLYILNTLTTNAYQVTGNPLEVNDLYVQSGRLTLGEDLSCNILDANPVADAERSIDFGGQKLSVRFGGTTPAVDFNSAAGRFSTLNASTSTIESVSTSQFTVEAGANDLEVPNFLIENALRAYINTNTATQSTATTVVFHDITMNRVTSGQSQLRIDFGNPSFGARKEYGSITLENNTAVFIVNPNGTAFGADNSIVNGNLDFADGSTGSISGEYFDVVGTTTFGDGMSMSITGISRFTGDFTLGATAFTGMRFSKAVTFGSQVNLTGDAAIRLTTSSTFNGPVVVSDGVTIDVTNSSFPINTSNSTWTVGAGSTLNIGDGSGGNWIFNNPVTFQGTNTFNSNVSGSLAFQDLIINGDATFSLRPTTTIGGAVDIANNSTVAFSNTTTPNVTASGAWTIGTDVNLNIGDALDGTWVFDGTSSINVGSGSTVLVDPGTNDITFNDIALTDNVTFTLKHGQTTTVTGTFSSAGGYCSTPNTLNSTSPGTQAVVVFSGAVTASVLDVRDINDSGFNLTVIDGTDVFNNTNVTFNNSPQTIYWVGGTAAADAANKGGTASTGDNNNWSNPDNWSITDGVYTGTNSCIPRSTDDVFFNANSFTPAVTNVILDADGGAGNLTFFGVTDTPTFTAAAGRELTLGGSLTLVAAMTWNNAGNILFTGDVGAGTYGVTSAGHTLAEDLRINSFVAAILQQVDAMVITGELGLEDGEFSMNNQDITVNSFSANYGTANTRTIDFTSSTMSITGGGAWTPGAQQIVFDLRSDDNTNLTVNSTATSTVDFIGNVDDVQLQMGSQVKTIPNLVFSGTNDDVIIFTTYDANCTGRLITFRDITVQKDGVSFSMDNNEDFATSTNSNNRGNRKVFGTITLQDNSSFRFYTPHSNSCSAQVTSFTDADQSSIGAFNFGDGTGGFVRARYLNIAGASSFGQDTKIIFHEQTEFDSDLTLGGTVSTPFLEFRRELRFNGGTLSVNGNATLTSFRNTIFNNVNIASGADVNFIPEQNERDWTFNGDILMNSNSQFKIGNFRRTDLIFNGNVTVSDGVFFETNNNSHSTVFNGDLSFDKGSVWVYSQNTVIDINAGFTASGTCQEFISFRSTANGNAVEFVLADSAHLEGVIINDLRNTGDDLVVNNGQDGGGNDLTMTGGGLGPVATNPVQFTNGGGNDTYYWIGGKAIGAGNNLWSDPLNWSTVDGALPGTANVCTPGETDNVFFNENSFDGIAGLLDVEVDVINISLNEWRWVGVDEDVIFDPTSTVETRTITVFNNFTWSNRVDNQYEGSFIFDNIANGYTQRKFIDAAGVPFFGGVRFDKQTTTRWELTNNLDINGGERGDLEIERGRLDPGGFTISLEDDLTMVNSNGGYLAISIGATVDPFTLIFDGQDDNPTTQILSNGRGNMDRLQLFDVIIDRQSNSTADNSKVVIQYADGTTGAATYNRFDGNIQVLTGNLEIDNDLTVVGDGGATDFQLSANTYLTLIGMDQNADNTFPEGWGTYTFDPTSTVRYARETHDNGQADGFQNISNTPVYGNLELSGRDTKTLTGGDLSMTGNLLIAENVTLDDNGNQILVNVDGGNDDTFTMESNSRFIIGNTGGNTAFPTGFNAISLDNTLGGEAIIQYNGDGAQNIDDLSATGTDYPVLQISNSGTKTITGNVGILRSITMDGSSTLSNAAGNTLEFKDGNGNSDWIISGTSTYIPGGLVYFNGTNHDVNDGTGNLALRDLTLNCPNGLTLSSNLEVQNDLTFVDGIINTGVNHIFVSDPALGAMIGYDDTHFINGTLRRAIANNTLVYPFPIADGTNSTDYHFAELLNNNLQGVSYVDVSVLENVEIFPNADSRFASKGLTAHEKPLTRIAGEAEWKITPDVQPVGGDYGVRLYLKNITEISAVDDNTFTVVKRIDGSVDYDDFEFGASDPTLDFPQILDGAARNLNLPGRVYDSGNGYAERTNFTGFSQFAIALTSNITVLPIEIVYFDAQLVDEVVELEWHTASEQNSDIIVLQRSDDLETWTDIDEKSAKGDSRELTHYYSTDEEQIDGIAYYRLMEIDIHGNKTVYSDIVSVNNFLSNEEGSISVFPNPLEGDFVNIFLRNQEANEEVEIRILDANGTEIYSDYKVLSDDGNAEMAIEFDEELSAGSYVIQVVSGSGINISRFMKN